jgi:hypothetical protein
MSTRIRISTGILTAAIGIFALQASNIAGQNSTSKPTAKPATGTSAAPRVATTQKAAAATDKPYRAPRTVDGQPDLQGYWTNATLVPLQRPQGVTTEFLPREEFEKRVAQRAAADEEQTKPGTTADVHYDFSQFALDKTQSPIAENYRTSLIVDPPDGRLPPQTPEAQKRLQAAAAARKQQGATYDRVQNISQGSRCIVAGGAGPPLMDAGYNANYQIVQSKDTVMILTEMIHDARIIPIDKQRPAPPSGYKGWMGASRGWWEGDTLVVETTHFNGRNPFQQASTDTLKVTERFTRKSADQIAYRFTVEDPNAWTRPWTAEAVLQTIEGPIFEHACHEGNYGIANTLAGVRLEEKLAAEEAAKKGTK